jgi:hypothetical protein
MFHIFSYWGNTNQNYIEIPLKQKTSNAGNKGNFLYCWWAYELAHPL